MPQRRGRGQGKSDAAGPRSAGDGDAAGAAPEAEPAGRTFSAPSGKSYAIAQAGFGEGAPPEMAGEIVSAEEGDLLELLLMHNDWAYGRRFKAVHDGGSNEGVFRLDWVHGIRLVIENGQRRPVEVEISSPDYGFQPPRPTDTAAKLRLKRWRKRMEDAAKAWGSRGLGGATAAEEAAAAKVAAALEKEDAKQKAQKLQAEQRRQQRERQQPEALGGREEAQAEAQQVVVEEAQQLEAQEEQLAPSPEAREDCHRLPFNPEPRLGPKPQVEWDARWEVEAANLEKLLSESSSGVEDSSDGMRKARPLSVQKKITRGKLARGILQAKRTGELHAIAEEWERAHAEMANKASDLSALNEKVKRSHPGAGCDGDLERLAEQMASEAERQAAEVKALKMRVFRALMSRRRSEEKSEEFERTTSDMDSAQKELEMKALQLKSLMKRAWQGMLETKRQKQLERQESEREELERIADEMAEQLQTRADLIKQKMRQGLLRAHRTGELKEMRNELDELADSEPAPLPGGSSGAGCLSSQPPRTPPRRRWTDYSSSDSDACHDASEAARQRLSGCPTSPNEADISSSEYETSPRS